jgi:hypothetical protein
MANRPIRIDIETTAHLFAEVYRRGLDHGLASFNCPDEVVRIAAKCGLGVLTAAAKQQAVDSIRADYRRHGRYDEAMYAKLSADRGLALRWAEHLFAAAQAHPPSMSYPIAPPADHVAGAGTCFGLRRKGVWSDECYRNAWGNTQPYGLGSAMKPCPRCGKFMSYWCWGGLGDPAACWSIDHDKSLKNGGCHCHFNLRALHPKCNSSKGSLT